MIRSDINSQTDIERFAAAAPLWTPLSLGTSLKFWLNADDTTSGLTSTWTDRVGAIAVTASGTEPTSNLLFNGTYRGVSFNGTTTYLTTTSLGSIPTGATAGEMWTMASNLTVGSTATGRPVAMYGDTAGISRAIMRVGISNINRAQINNATTNLLTDTVADFSGPHIIGGMWSGTTQSGRVDGQDFNPASMVMVTLATSTARLRLGANTAASPTVFYNGGVRQVLITLILTALQRQQLEGWLAWDSGLASLLPVGHPYKSAPP